MGLPEIIILSTLTAVIILAVSYVLGIILVETLKIPAPKYMNKKLAAFLAGFSVVLCIITAIVELTGIA